MEIEQKRYSHSQTHVEAHHYGKKWKYKHQNQRADDSGKRNLFRKEDRKYLSKSKLKQLEGMIFWAHNQGKNDNIERIHEELYHTKSKSKQGNSQNNYGDHEPNTINKKNAINKKQAKEIAKRKIKVYLKQRKQTLLNQKSKINQLSLPKLREIPLRQKINKNYCDYQRSEKLRENQIKSKQATEMNLVTNIRNSYDMVHQLKFQGNKKEVQRSCNLVPEGSGQFDFFTTVVAEQQEKESNYNQKLKREMKNFDTLEIRQKMLEMAHDKFKQRLKKQLPIFQGGSIFTKCNNNKNNNTKKERPMLDKKNQSVSLHIKSNPSVSTITEQKQNQNITSIPEKYLTIFTRANKKISRVSSKYL